jgi:hypothetical protein
MDAPGEKKDKSGFIGVDFEEFKSGTYKYIYVDLPKKQSEKYNYEHDKRFSMGDPVKDFENGMNWAYEHGCEVVHYSSSVDDFVSDDGNYDYDKNNMIVKRTVLSKIKRIMKDIKYSLTKTDL